MTLNGISGVKMRSIISNGVLARKYDDEDDHDNQYSKGAYSNNDDDEAASTSASFPSDIDAGVGIQWISPISGISVQSGQSLLVSWRTYIPFDSAGFALCTTSPSSSSSSSSPASCGKQSWPIVNDQKDGTFSTTLTMPVIPQSQAQNLYLKITSTNGEVYQSPSFVIAGQGSRNAYIASTTDIDSAYQTQTLAGISASSTITWGSARGSVIRTLSVSSPSMSVATPNQPNSYIGTNPYPTITPQAQAQMPLIATAIPMAASAESQPTATAGILQAHASQPKITAIALPLTLCGLILLSALIFCARSKALRKTGHKSDKNDDEENDWQAIVKEKAAASAASVKGSKGVKVIERYDTHDRERENRSKSRTSSSDCRSRSPPPYTRSKTRREDKFTSIPEINGRHSCSGHSAKSIPFDLRAFKNEERYDCNNNHQTRCAKESRRNKYRSREGYYSTTRRSSDGLGGIYIHPQVEVETFDRYRSTSRSKVDSHDDYGFVFERDRKRAPSACAYHHEKLWRAREHEVKSTSTYRHDNSSCECERDRNTKIQAVKVLRPQPKQADSFGPLTNPHPPSSQDVRQAVPAETGIDTRRLSTNRPLPLPIIRTSSTSYSDPEKYRSEDFGYVQRGKSTNWNQEEQPHLTGALAFDPHEQDWELANQGKYTSGEEGMEELYDSLRRAIARS